MFAFLRASTPPLSGLNKILSTEEYEDFMDNVEDFEKDLVKDGDYLFKLWFSIDKETQANRFKMRQASPLKYLSHEKTKSHYCCPFVWHAV